MLEEKGLSESSAYIPPLALRGDLAAALSLSKYALKLLSIGTKGTLLTGPFSDIMDRFQVRSRRPREFTPFHVLCPCCFSPQLRSVLMP
jgi:hypothetical protein